MATVTVNILPCQHIVFTASNGARAVMTRDELVAELKDEETIRQALMVQIRSLVRERRASGDTWAQVKAALEAAEFRV